MTKLKFAILGGVAMLGGLAVAFLLALEMPFLGRYARVAHDAYAVLWAGLVICVVGVLDDKYDLPPWAKFAGQITAAGVAVAGGVRLYWIPLPDRIVGLDPASSIMITVVVIALCVNAVNMVDGLDGLVVPAVAPDVERHHPLGCSVVQGSQGVRPFSIMSSSVCLSRSVSIGCQNPLCS